MVVGGPRPLGPAGGGGVQSSEVKESEKTRKVKKPDSQDAHSVSDNHGFEKGKTEVSLDGRKGLQRSTRKTGGSGGSASLRNNGGMRPLDGGSPTASRKDKGSSVPASVSSEMVPLDPTGRGPTPMVPAGEVEAAREAEAARARELSSEQKGELRQKAHAILGNPNEREGARELATVLRQLPSEQRSELIRQMVTTSPALTSRVLGTASQLTHIHGNLSGGERDVIAHAFGEAYNNKALSQSDLKSMLNPEHHGFHRNPMALAKMIGQTGNTQLQTDAAKEMLRHGEANPTRNQAFLAGAAEAVSTNPNATSNLLKTLGTGERLNKFVSAIGPSAFRGRGDLAGKPVLANLIRSANKVSSPPTDGARALFDQGLRNVAGDGEMREALGEYFNTHTIDTTERLTRTAGQRLEDRATLTRLTEELVFSDPYPGQDDTQAAFGNELNRRLLELGQGGQPTDMEGQRALEEKSRQFGSLIGGTEVGFRRALQSVKNENATRKTISDLFVDMVAGPAKSAIPFDVTIPGVGSLKDKSVDLAKEQISAYFAKANPDPLTMLRPFVQMETFLPPDLVDEAAATSGRFHDLHELGVFQ